MQDFTCLRLHIIVLSHNIILVWLQDIGRTVFFVKHFLRDKLSYILAEIDLVILKDLNVKDLGAKISCFMKNGPIVSSQWTQEYCLYCNNQLIAKGIAKLVAFDFVIQSKAIIPRQSIDFFQNLARIEPPTMEISKL